jgi:hypothetical protein
VRALLLVAGQPGNEAALEAIANLLATGKTYGIGITFEPDEEV